MTDIKISYTQNTKGKFDFVASQNGEILYEKTYSPIKSKGQHLMAKVLVDVFNIQVEKELAVNPNFMWESFEDFEAWANESLLNKHVDFNMATVEEYNPDTGMWEDWYDEEGLDYEDTKQKDFV